MTNKSCAASVWCVVPSAVEPLKSSTLYTFSFCSVQFRIHRCKREEREEREQEREPPHRAVFQGINLYTYMYGSLNLYPKETVTVGNKPTKPPSL